MLSARCTEGLLHLVDEHDKIEGRIEICSNGVWGTIYAGNWDFTMPQLSVDSSDISNTQVSRVMATKY